MRKHFGAMVALLLFGLPAWQAMADEEIPGAAEPGATEEAIAGLLDGRSFEILMSADDGTVKTDTLVFVSGTFESIGCRSYGFGPVGYMTAPVGDDVTFSAVATSAEEGTMTWQATISGTSLTGSAVWQTEGQDDVVYALSGAESPLIQ